MSTDRFTMELLPLSEVSISSASATNTRVYRYRWHYNMVVGVVFLSLAVAAPFIFDRWTGSMIGGVVIALFMLLFAKLAIGMARACLKPSAWILRVQADGALIHLQSPFLHTPPPGPTVLSIPWDQIQCVSHHQSEKSTGFGESESTVQFHQLEISLKEAIPEDIQDAIKSGNRRRNESTRFGIKTSSKVAHTPVTVANAYTLRLPFKGVQPGVKPKLKDALNACAAHVPMGEAAAEPLPEPQSMSDSAFDDHILALAESGQKLTAIKLLREREGMSLVDAKTFVDGLTQTPPEEHPA